MAKTQNRHSWIVYLQAQVDVIVARGVGLSEASDKEDLLLFRYAIRQLATKTDFAIGQWDKAAPY